ncbi:antibiotic biosynthesis monooxygenase subfamily protein [Streptococcus pneumoniae]|nr:antibiotic biosynthesis monooxygenase subfamily protein [Streptococcus pneumoniae]
MTLTIHVYYKGDGDCAIKFVREMLESGLVAEIRCQKGNLKYEYFLPPIIHPKSKKHPESLP